MKNIIITLIGFLLYRLGINYFEPVMLFIDQAVHYKLVSYILTYLLMGIPIFVAVCFINKDFHILRHLGLESRILQGLFIGVLFSLPMFAGALFQSKLADGLTLSNLLAKTLLAGFFEELYFRGFFFGQLFRKTRLGFLPAIFFCSLVFASGHFYQSHDPGTLFGIFLTTFMGSVLFAWLYVEWNYNLWVPIFLHTFMNLSWTIFAVSENALGTVNSNLYRGLTIALSIVLTLVYKKRKGEKLFINRDTLFLKRRTLSDQEN